jgi:hypothetical protein
MGSDDGNAAAALCSDLVYFHKLLLQRRRLDDILPQRLNLVGRGREREDCFKLYREMQANFHWRTRSINTCLSYFCSDDSEARAPSFEREKNIRLLREYLEVETILRRQAWTAFFASQCRCLQGELQQNANANMN